MMQVIEHYEVPSGGVSSIVFSSIPDTFTDLLLLTSLRTTNSPDSPNTYGLARVAFNGSETVSRRELIGYGSGTQSGSGTTLNLQASGSVTTANTFSNNSMYITNYTAAAAKSVSLDMVHENNATQAWQFITAVLWNSTAALTSLTLTGVGGNLTQYSSASLYGITAGSDGIVAVS
jgi:hypothetical protein